MNDKALFLAELHICIRPSSQSILRFLMSTKTVELEQLAFRIHEILLGWFISEHLTLLDVVLNLHHRIYRIPIYSCYNACVCAVVWQFLFILMRLTPVTILVDCAPQSLSSGFPVAVKYLCVGSFFFLLLLLANHFKMEHSMNLVSQSLFLKNIEIKSITSAPLDPTSSETNLHVLC